MLVVGALEELVLVLDLLNLVWVLKLVVMHASVLILISHNIVIISFRRISSSIELWMKLLLRRHSYRSNILIVLARYVTVSER